MAATALAISLSPVAASAEETPEVDEVSDAVRHYVVRMQPNSPRLRYALRDATTNDLVIRCSTACRTAVPAGRYRVVVDSPDDEPRSRVIRIDAPVDLRVHATNAASRTTGLVLAISGGVADLVGSFLLLPLLATAGHDSVDEDEDEGASTRGLIGLALVGAGAAASSVGWVMFARNTRPRVEQRRYEVKTRQSRIQPWLAVSPTAGSDFRQWGFVASVAF